MTTAEPLTPLDLALNIRYRIAIEWAAAFGARAHNGDTVWHAHFGASATTVRNTSGRPILAIPPEISGPRKRRGAWHIRHAAIWDPAHAMAYLGLAAPIADAAVALTHHVDPDNPEGTCPAATEPMAPARGPCDCRLDQRRLDALAPLVAIYGTNPAITRPKGKLP